MLVTLLPPCINKLQTKPYFQATPKSSKNRFVIELYTGVLGKTITSDIYLFGLVAFCVLSGK